MWRGGCIIRSIFLNDIAAAFEAQQKPKHLLLAPYFRRNQRVALRLEAPCSPCDERGTACSGFLFRIELFLFAGICEAPANMIQAQRDYFGAHTFERTDELRGQFFHENWTGHGGDTKSGTYNV